MTVNEGHLLHEGQSPLKHMINENWLKLDVCHRKDDNASPLTSTWLYVVAYMFKPTKCSLMAVSHQSRWTIALSEKVFTTMTAETLYCSTCENLPIDASIVMVGLILTRRDRVQDCNTRQGNQNACCSAELAPPLRMPKTNATNNERV